MYVKKRILTVYTVAFFECGPEIMTIQKNFPKSCRIKDSVSIKSFVVF